METHDDPDWPELPQADPSLPHAIGRFVVLRRIGRGSMGEVFSAYDEELARRVAIKLVVQPEASGSRRARMRREAQAMAKVSHANVIHVFDVGEHGQRTFIAMEYVEGQTLERWERRPERTLPQLLDAYLQAGAGLAAAHRAGVLHRDFKPANVLVDAEGQVKVLDFGLAAWLEGDAPAAGGSGGTESIGAAATPETRESSRLTRVGAVLGTPAFMSPEQFRGEALDARSDQFSFCVALYEAAVGVHPFGGDSVDDLRTSILAGKVRSVPAARDIPPSLHEVLLRGLARNPADRWPDMDALLAALRPAPRRARWGWVAAAVVVSVGAGSVAYGVAASRPGLCEGSQQQLERIWNDERRASAKGGLERTGTALATPTWSRVEPELDAYGQEWAAARQRVCEATQVLGEQSPELMDERMACLDLRLDAMSGLLGAFERADLETVLRAVDATSRLPELAACETTGVGASADPEATRPEAQALRQRLVAARASLDLGRAEEARIELEAIRGEAEAQRLPRLAAEALVRRGKAEEGLGRLTQADSTLEAGLWAALSEGNDETAFDAAVELLQVVGVVMGDEARGRAGIARAEALLRRQGDLDAARIRFLDASGKVLARHGDYREGRVRLDEALALAERVHGTEHAVYAAVLNATGAAALWGADLDEAERIFGELVELDRKLYDPKHTKVAAALNNLAIVMARKGDVAAAEERFQEVYEVRRSALGDDHVEVADALLNLCGAMMQRGEPEAALQHLERARAIYAASLGEDSTKTESTDLMRSMALTKVARWDEAEPILRSVLARQRRRLGEHHPDLGPTLGTLGRLLNNPESAAEAVELLGEAIEIQRGKLTSSGLPFDQDAVLTELERERAKAQRVLRGEEPELEPGGAAPG